jgi:hypothetical protein
MGDRVGVFLHELCQMDRYGGRCARPDDGVWELFDVSQWTEAHGDAVRASFPSLSVRVVTCRKSLSGFSVVLSLQRSSHVWTSLLVCAVMVAAMGALARGLAPHTCSL